MGHNSTTTFVRSLFAEYPGSELVNSGLYHAEYLPLLYEAQDILGDFFRIYYTLLVEHSILEKNTYNTFVYKTRDGTLFLNVAPVNWTDYQQVLCFMEQLKQHFTPLSKNYVSNQH